MLNSLEAVTARVSAQIMRAIGAAARRCNSLAANLPLERTKAAMARLGAGTSSGRFELLRYFSISAAVAMLVIALAVFHLYKAHETAELLRVAETHNATLARSFANTIGSRYADYVVAVAHQHRDELLARTETVQLDQEIRRITSGIPVHKVKILSLNGNTVYSSEFGQIGESKQGNEGFLAAVRSGRPSSKMSFRGEFAAFSGFMANVDLVETYVPVQDESGTTRLVLELYSDVSAEVAQLRRDTWRAFGLTVVASALIYLVLLLVVRRADSIIERQYTELAGMTARLEALVAERTRELSTANADVSCLNSELASNIRRLEEAQEEIVRRGKLAQLGRLTATVAHEMRNPLGSIKASLQLFERKARDKQLGVEKAIGRIHTGISRCDRIITELLDFTRNNAFVRRPGDLDAWVKAAVEEEVDALHAPVALVWDLGIGDAAVSFEPDRLRRVIVNLVSNAAEAMIGKPGMQLVSPTAHPRIEIRTRLVDGRVELTVEDNGPGITEEHLSRIREPLFTTKSFGIGLGLPAVEEILKQHGGGLRIASTPGAGAAFTAWFPALEPGIEAKAA